MKTEYKMIFAVIAFSFNVSYAQNIESGKWYIEQEQYKTAKKIFTSLINNNSSDARACFYLGQIYFLLDQPDSADYYYQSGLRAAPQEPLNYAGAGKIQLNKKNRPEALLYFEKGKKLAARNLYYYLEVAEACIAGKEKDFKTAALYLEEAKKIGSKNPDYYIALGDLYLLTKSAGDAANEYDNAIYYDRFCTEAYIKLGNIYANGKNYKDAVNAYTTAFSLDSSQFIAYKYLGDLSYIFGKYPEAKKYYELYIPRSENDPADLEKYAFILFFNKDYQHADEVMNEVIQAYPDIPVLYRLQAYINYETGDYVTGLKNIEDFFAIQDSQKIIPLDYVYYGRLLIRNNQDSIAAIKLQKAIEMDSTRYDLYDEIAKSLSKINKHNDAITAYNELLKRNPGAKFNLIYQIGREYYLMAEEEINIQDSIRKMEIYKKADSTFTILTQMDSTSYIGYIWRGRCLSKLDPEATAGLAKPSYDKALMLLETGDTLKNQKLIIECNRYLAFYYYVLGDKEYKTNLSEARSNFSISLEHWKKIIELDPTDVQSQTAIENLKKILK
jgi:tetratricopeptide (TPR) repeat protein